VKHWVMAAMHFDKVEMKALEQIFLQKQRYDSLSRLCSLILLLLSSFYKIL
jgi:hypothetical protein